MLITLISPYPDIRAYGIRIISACLKREKHDVQILFLPKLFTERYENTMLDKLVTFSKESDLIGISLMTNFFDNAVQITQKLKENNDIPILWGGIHPTLRPEECLNYADMACISEGEESVVELANKIRDGEYYYNIHGIWFKDKEKIIKKNPNRPLTQDLDNRTHYILNNASILVSLCTFKRFFFSFEIETLQLFSTKSVERNTKRELV